MSESGRICLPAYEPVPSNYAWRLQSIGAIALSIEVPFVFGRQNPRGLCVHEVLFQGAVTPSVANITASVSMIAVGTRITSRPPAQIRMGPIRAYGSHLGCMTALHDILATCRIVAPCSPSGLVGQNGLIVYEGISGS